MAAAAPAKRAAAAAGAAAAATLGEAVGAVTGTVSSFLGEGVIFENDFTDTSGNGDG